jgi:hypothetical protein
VYSMHCPIYRPYGGGARSCHFGAAGVHHHALAGGGRAASGQAHARSFLKGQYLSHDISCTSLDESPGYITAYLSREPSDISNPHCEAVGSGLFGVRSMTVR